MEATPRGEWRGDYRSAIHQCQGPVFWREGSPLGSARWTSSESKYRPSGVGGGSSQGILSRPKHSTGARHIQGIQALQTAVSPSQEFQDTKSSGGRHGKPNGTRLCQLQGMLKASCCSGTQTLDDVRPKSSTLPAFPRSPLKLGNGLSSFTGAKGARGGETTQHNRS